MPTVTHNTRIDYALTDDEYRQFVIDGYARQGVKFNLALMILTWVIIYPLVPFIPALIARRPIDGVVIAGWCATVLVGAYVVFLTRAQFRKGADKAVTDPMVRRLMDGVAIELLPDRIMSTTKSGASSYEWSLVSAIVRKRDRAYIWLGRWQAIIVPRRVCHTDDEFNRFIELACEYKYGKSNRAMCAKCSYDLRGNPGSRCPECGADQNALEYAR